MSLGRFRVLLGTRSSVSVLILSVDRSLSVVSRHSIGLLASSIAVEDYLRRYSCYWFGLDLWFAFDYPLSASFVGGSTAIYEASVAAPLLVLPCILRLG